MELIATIPYDEVDFKFIINHYDLHLSGICRYNGKTCYFKTIEGEYNYEEDEWNESFCEIYKLTFREKWKYFWIRKKFECMVGYHWTYPQRKMKGAFYYRKPVCIYKYLFNLFYKKK